MSLEGYTTVQGRFSVDFSGPTIDLPVVLCPDGVLESVCEYQLTFSAKSLSWHLKLCQGVRLFLYFSAANCACYRSPRKLFRGFAERLITGTIAKEGIDSSELGWRSRRRSNARQIIRMLTELSTWVAERFDVAELNPSRSATKSEKLLKMVAWTNRNDRSFLGHTVNRAKFQSAFDRAPFTPYPVAPNVEVNDIVAFPEQHFPRLLFEGFSRRIRTFDAISRLDLRNILIVLLLHGAGLRTCECFHLFVQDVTPDPHDPTVALVRIGHPTEGLMRWKDSSGKVVEGSRRQYLATLGLTPRNLICRSGHAGWKNPKCDGKYYIQAHWSDKVYGRLFLGIWRRYLCQIAAFPLRKHPFAFVNQSGGMYTRKAFFKAYHRAIINIGLVPARRNGTEPHSHRHAYGIRLDAANISPSSKKMALHHSSLESQEVYTRADARRLQSELDAAIEMMGDTAEKTASAAKPFLEMNAL